MDNFSTSFKYLEWTNRLEDIIYFFANTTKNDSTYCLEGLLLMSSIFERAVGNVIFSKFELRTLFNYTFTFVGLSSKRSYCSVFVKRSIKHIGNSFDIWKSTGKKK